jgi:hypothetical protein
MGVVRHRQVQRTQAHQRFEQASLVRQFKAKNSVFRQVPHVTMRVSGRFL